MISYLRLVLAFLVLLSHLDIRIYGLNPGVTAVVIFYLLAGHVIARLFLFKFKISNIKKRIAIFYFERFLRIYPLYIFFLVITGIFLILTGYGNPEFRFENIITNALIIPLNYYMFLEDKIIVLRDTNPPWWLIPQAWSLGAEIQVYILMPLLLIFRKLAYVLFFMSVSIYSLANLNLIHSDYFGYRIIAGTLFMFLIGAFLEMISKGKANKIEKFIVLTAYVFFVAWFLIFVVAKGIYGTYTRETLLGLIVGIPLIYFFLKLKFAPPLYRLAGNLSYGIFLAHFLGIWFLDYINITADPLLKVALVSGISIILSIVGIFFIEKPVENYRYKLGKEKKECF